MFCLIFADGFPLLVGFWHLIEKAKGMLPIFGPANRGSELVGIYGLYFREMGTIFEYIPKASNHILR